MSPMTIKVSPTPPMGGGGERGHPPNQKRQGEKTHPPQPPTPHPPPPRPQDPHAVRHARPVGEPADQRRHRRDVSEPEADPAENAISEIDDPQFVEIDAERGQKETAGPA